MKLDNSKVASILQFYLNDMELEDKIMEALLDEDEDEETNNKVNRFIDSKLTEEGRV